MVAHGTLMLGASTFTGAALDLSWAKNGNIELKTPFSIDANQMIKEGASSLFWRKTLGRLGNAAGSVADQMGTVSGSIMAETGFAVFEITREQCVEKAISPTLKE